MFDDLKEKVMQLAGPVIAAEGMDLIHVECLKMHKRWLIRIYLDKEPAITLDDCAAVSNQLGDIFDINDLVDSPYTLEVSSPGWDRPISRDQDFIRYKGSQVNIKTSSKIDGVKNFHGYLQDFIEENGGKVIIIEVSGKKYRIPKSEIIRTNLADTGCI